MISKKSERTRPARPRAAETVAQIALRWGPTEAFAAEDGTAEERFVGGAMAVKDIRSIVSQLEEVLDLNFYPPSHRGLVTTIRRRLGYTHGV